MKAKFIFLIFFLPQLVLAKMVILDVRTPQEFQADHVESAINIDVRSPDFRPNVMKLNRDDEYFIYCGTGKRATVAEGIMRELQFKHVTNLMSLENAKKTLKK